MALFKIISTCKGGGYRYARTDPLHPNANSNGLYPLHRVLMENHLGRLLTYNETVHHKNEDKTDDRLENLEVLTRAAHTAEHVKKAEPIKTNCACCQKEMLLRPNVFRRRTKVSKLGICCSRSCQVTLQHRAKTL